MKTVYTKPAYHFASVPSDVICTSEQVYQVNSVLKDVDPEKIIVEKVSASALFN